MSVVFVLLVLLGLVGLGVILSVAIGVLVAGHQARRLEMRRQRESAKGVQ